MARRVHPQRGPMLKWIVNTLSNRLLCGLLIGWVGSSIGLAQAPSAKPIREVIASAAAAADDSFATVRVSDGTPLLTPAGKAVRINPKAVEYAETDSGLRRAMKEVSDLVALADPDLTKRRRAMR